MKKLFAILLVTILTSCGGSISNEPAEATEQSGALEPPKSNIDYKNIIGKSIKIGNLEIAQYDFPEGTINWENGNYICTYLGKGWRLPTKEELNFLYKNQNKIGGFVNSNYWSSSEYAANYERGAAWTQNFDVGSQDFINKGTVSVYVRSVRSL